MADDPITEAFLGLLKGDPQISNLLGGARYRGEVPVFGSDPVPDDAEPPYIQTSGQSFVDPNQNLDGKFQAYGRPVRVYFPRSGDTSAVQETADRTTQVITRDTLAVTGYETKHVTYNGPIVQNPDDDTYGRVVIFDFWLYSTT